MHFPLPLCNGIRIWPTSRISVPVFSSHRLDARIRIHKPSAVLLGLVRPDSPRQTSEARSPDGQDEYAAVSRSFAMHKISISNS